jgi:hypothetical protein
MRIDETGWASHLGNPSRLSSADLFCLLFLVCLLASGTAFSRAPVVCLVLLMWLYVVGLPTVYGA